MKLSTEVISDQPDPMKCVERFISDPKELSTSQSTLRFNVSFKFLNTFVIYFLQYMQNLK